MDISNSLQSRLNNTLGKNSTAKTTVAEALQSQKSIQSSGKDGDSDDSQAIDSAKISAEGYELAATATVSGVTNDTRIPSEQKAKELASNIAEMAKNNPADLQKVTGKVSEAGVLRLLAA